MASIYRRTYKVTLPSGETVIREYETYTIAYTDAAGRRRRVAGYRDRKATEQKAARMEKDVERGEEGLVDRFKKHKASTLLSHIEGYIADLRAKGRAEMYCYTSDRRLRILTKACGWQSLTDIDANSFLKWREKMRKTRQAGAGRTGEPISARTVNQYLEHARSFLAWCKAVKRYGANPLEDVAKVTGQAVRLRRALSDEQASTLLGVTPAGRKLFYRLAMAVGLRRAELGALQWGDVRLNAIKPYIQLRAEATKARRADQLRLPSTLAADLRADRPADATDADRVFLTPPTIDDWKDDLAAAGIPWKDDMGRQLDFHAGTRKTLCTRMNRAGVPLAVAMKIMRHTDARLTLVDYTDDEQLGLGDVLASMPEPTAAPKAAADAAKSSG